MNTSWNNCGIIDVKIRKSNKCSPVDIYLHTGSVPSSLCPVYIVIIVSLNCLSMLQFKWKQTPIKIWIFDYLAGRRKNYLINNLGRDIGTPPKIIDVRTHRVISPSVKNCPMSPWKENVKRLTERHEIINISVIKIFLIT